VPRGRTRRPYRVEVERGCAVALGVLMLAITALFAVGVWLGEGLWDRVFAGACGLFVLLLGAYWLHRSRYRSTPIITVRDEGIEHQSAGLIRWNEIEDVTLRRLPNGDPAVAVWTHEPDLVARRSKGFHRLMARLDLLFGQPQITIPDLLAEPEELKREIEDRRRRASAP
jgi:hypothetical protein